MSGLRKIPNIGERTERDLIAMGYTSIESLKGKRAEELYAEECALRGYTLDRCQLYLLRAVEYFVNTEKPDPKKCKWWHWKDEFVQPAPCGTSCAQDCSFYPASCQGCRAIKGIVYWLPYTGVKCCPIYDCCVNQKGSEHCGTCTKIPCEHWQLRDPTLPDDLIEQNLAMRLERLKTSPASQNTEKEEESK